MGRMRVDDGADVGTGFVNGRMHQEFAGAFAMAGDLIALQINHADVIGLQIAFGDSSRRAKNAIFADTERVVAFVAGAEALEPDAPADVAHLLFELPFGDAGVAGL